MPAKNSVKLYLENSYYHIYNRGAGKGEIFLEDQDYRVFLHYLEKYLDKKSDHTLANEVKLLAYCLMPNHFHLFVHQVTNNGIVKFMRALSTSYAMYFNKKYQRSGTLFQGIYKAALIENEPYYLHLSRYIHLNPSGIVENCREYPYSSYKAYLGMGTFSWLDPGPVLHFFGQSITMKSNAKNSSYQSFVEEYTVDSKEHLGDLAID